MAIPPASSGAAHHASLDPIRVVPLHDEARLAPAPAATPSLTYRGGPLLTAVQIFTLFWGDGWQEQPQAGLMAQIVAFFDFVVASPLVDQLDEYSVAGSVIGHGANLGAIAVAGALGASVDDSAIQQFIQQRDLDELRRAPADPELALFRVRAAWSGGQPQRQQLLHDFLRLPQRHQRSDLLRGHALPRLHGLHRLAHGAGRFDLDDLARAVRGDHRPDPRPGLVRRQQR